MQNNRAAILLGKRQLGLECLNLRGAACGRLGFVVKIQADFAHQQRGMLAKMLRQFVQHAGVCLLGIPRMDAQRDGADFRLPQQRERVCPIGVFGGGHDKLAHLRGAGLGDDLRQPEKQGGVGEMGVGVGEHGINR